MRFSDLQVLFISSASTDLLDDYKIIADKALVRYQFMEMLVRIAVDKYGKKDLDIVSSISQFFEKDGLMECLRNYDVAQDWRDKRFWNKECDEILTMFTDPIKQIYQYLNTLSIKSQNHRTKLINHTDFLEMCNMCEFTNEYISDKEIMQIYFMSIST